MEDKYSLEGKLVTIFLRGSWEFTGRVEFASKDKVVLLSDMGSLVIYKENIVAAMIVDERKAKESLDGEAAPEYDVSIRARNLRPASMKMPYELDQQDQYGSVIPEDMLEGSSEEFPVNFSMSMDTLRNIKENKSDPPEKAPSNRGKNKARM